MLHTLPPKKPEKERKITFFTKDAIRCPVCDASFHREELFSGRVNADEMTDELHRTYMPLHTFGDVFPLVYEVDVCPSCFYAAFRNDFLPGGTKAAEILRARMDKRIEDVQLVFTPLDYQTSRGLLEGAASYFLAISCYEHFAKEFSPTIKCAISAVRTAWLCHDLHGITPSEN